MHAMNKLTVALLLVVLTGSALFAHCQIPCGIYGDQTRFTILREHIDTIEKSMNQINVLSKDPAANMNQLVRWVNNKESHAEAFTEIVTYYFLAQRIKVSDMSDEAAYLDYQKKVTVLHQMMVSAMKCKQTTDPANTEQLRTLVDSFEGMYFSEEDKEHLKEHNQ